MKQITEVRHRWSAYTQTFTPYHPMVAKALFIKGPISLPWIGQAARLPGKTLHVALALQYMAGLTNSRTVKLTAKTLTVFGVSRDAKSEALARLRHAGLISVNQSPGRAPFVTLLGAEVTMGGCRDE